MADSPSPSWPGPSKVQANHLSQEFKSNLRAVAESLASHDRALSVSTRHVEESFSALSRLGLSSRPFYRRPEFSTGLGGLLIGLAFSCPDVIQLLMPDSPEQKGTTAGVFFGATISGVVFYAIGWYHGKLPSPPRTWPKRLQAIADWGIKMAAGAAVVLIVRLAIFTLFGF